MNDSNSLLKKLIERRINLHDIESGILEEKKKYEETIGVYKANAENVMEEIEKIKKEKISVNAETLVQVIANEWGVEVEDVNVRVRFYNTAKVGKITKDKFIRFYKEDISKKVYLTFIVDYINNQKHFETVVGFNLFDIQKNSQRLIDFLIVETKYDEEGYKTDFVCPDYKNLIFNYKFSYLIDIDKCVPINKNAEIIYKAYERDCEEKENSYGK